MSLIQKDIEEKNYKTYITDILWAIMQRQGVEKIDVPRYAELAEKKEPQKEETAEDIIERISNNLLNMGK